MRRLANLAWAVALFAGISEIPSMQGAIAFGGADTIEFAPDGFFTVSLPEGEYGVEATVPGQPETVVEIQQGGRRLTDRGIHVGAPEVDPVELRIRSRR